MISGDSKVNFYASCANVLVCKVDCYLHSVVEQAWFLLAFGELANIVGICQ